MAFIVAKSARIDVLETAQVVGSPGLVINSPTIAGSLSVSGPLVIANGAESTVLATSAAGLSINDPLTIRDRVTIISGVNTAIISEGAAGIAIGASLNITGELNIISGANNTVLSTSAAGLTVDDPLHVNGRLTVANGPLEGVISVGATGIATDSSLNVNGSLRVISGGGDATVMTATAAGLGFDSPIGISVNGALSYPISFYYEETIAPASSTWKFSPSTADIASTMHFTRINNTVHFTMTCNLATAGVLDVSCSNNTAVPNRYLPAVDKAYSCLFRAVSAPTTFRMSMIDICASGTFTLWADIDDHANVFGATGADLFAEISVTYDVPAFVV